MEELDGGLLVHELLEDFEERERELKQYEYVSLEVLKKDKQTYVNVPSWGSSRIR